MIEEDQIKRIIDTKCIYCGKKIKKTYYYEIDSTIMPEGFKEYRIDEGICNDCYRKIKKELLEGFKNDK